MSHATGCSRMGTSAARLLAWFLMASASNLSAQSTGAVAGVVREAGADGIPLAGARVEADDGHARTATDPRGTYRLRELSAGWHRVRVAAIGYRPQTRDSVLVRAGQTTPLDFALTPDPVGLEPIEVIVERVDSVLDPLAVADQQRFTAEDLRRLPVSSVEEAIALSAGTVGESYRGGRLGQQAFVLDGLGLKNQLDAETGTLGIRIPPDLLAEASLITNGFSARYGQAVSALVNLATRDGDDRWGGRWAWETDRPLGAGGDLGLDRIVLSGSGPVAAGIRLVAVADLAARLDADPVNTPRPSDPRLPRHTGSLMLPHNSGEQADLGARLTIPLGAGPVLRLLALRSADQRLLFDPAYTYDPDLAPVRRTTGTYLSAHLQHTFAGRGLTTALRIGYFDREFLRGASDDTVAYRFGAFTGRSRHIIGEEIARAQDTSAARQALPGLIPPGWSDRTPWGVPAFFLGMAPRGDVAWNRFREIRTRLDLNLPAGRGSEFTVGAEYSGQRVRTFQRVLGYLPVGDSVPPAAAADFRPWAGAAFAEVQSRADDIAITFGLRYDAFRGRDDLPGIRATTHHALSPRAAVSTVLRGVTLVASFGRFQQAPDYQFLVDAAFDDTTRTGRFRAGNPGLGFENATQYEFSLRARPRPEAAVRLNLYVRRLDGLVASVPFSTNPDSSIFGNVDAGTVRGAEIIIEREFARHWGARVAYTLQEATAHSSSAFFRHRTFRVDSVTGDTIYPSRVEFPLDYDRRHTVTAILTGTVPGTIGPAVLGLRPLAGLEGTAILRMASGLPYSRVVPGTDSIVGLPNDYRLPTTWTLDLLVRRPIRFARFTGSAYLDVRNLLGRRNVIAVRRDNGGLRPSPTTLQAMADSAYLANPVPIPYESPRYRAWADLDGNGYVEGPAELQPLFLAAARDATQPLLFFGPPRLVRFGFEFGF